ncbi:hypothetical protein [Streptomyces sp. NBC_01304]|uniref:hypothetical protein n=1 Tax=Streptomyces sp. NBC_01304 TaxID=2903818 RepID=UPI002E143A3D|nr:hypothetical protein OG430_48110 [Streptomyces sp. NBC_01304]
MPTKNLHRTITLLLGAAAALLLALAAAPAHDALTSSATHITAGENDSDWGRAPLTTTGDSDSDWG